MRRLASPFLALLAFPLVAQSVPGTINYQGRLTDNSPAQAPVTATVSMQFAIYDAASGGTRLWQEPAADNTGTPVTVTGGIFNYLLGSGVALPPSLFTGASSVRFLQITLNPGGSPDLLTPRQLLTATGYANLAQNANAAASATTAATLAGNGANCAAGNYPLGIDAAGAAEGCTPAGTGTVTSVSAASPLSVTNPTTTPAITLGTVTVANGGTGTTSAGAAGGVLYSNGALFAPSAAGSATQVLHGGATPTWSAVTLADMGTSGCAAGEVPKFIGTAWTCAATPLVRFTTGSLVTAPMATLMVGTTGSTAAVALAIGADGLPVYAYGNPITVQKCTNSNCTSFSSAITLGVPASDGMDIAVPPDGNPVVVSRGGGGVRLIRCTAADCSSFGVPVTLDASASQPVVTVGTDGFPVIAYLISSTTVKVAKCANVGCTSGTVLTAISTGTQYSTPAIALGLDGLPFLAWASGSGVLTVKCGNPGCSAGNTSPALTISGSSLPAIMLGNDGRMLIASAHPVNGVQLLHCGNPDCSSGNSTVTLDTAVSFVDHLALAIDSEGNPVVAYLDHPVPTDRRRIVHCDSPTCAAGGTLVQLGTFAGSLGDFSTTALAVPSDGNPFLIYYDAVDGTSRRARCMNPSCIPWAQR